MAFWSRNDRAVWHARNDGQVKMEQSIILPRPRTGRMVKGLAFLSGKILSYGLWIQTCFSWKLEWFRRMPIPPACSGNILRTIKGDSHHGSRGSLDAGYYEDIMRGLKRVSSRAIMGVGQKRWFPEVLRNRVLATPPGRQPDYECFI